MRNLFTGAVAALAFATVLAGAASAAVLDEASQTTNLALQNQLERDATDHPLRRAGIGETISQDHQVSVLSTRAQDKG